MVLELCRRGKGQAITSRLVLIEAERGEGQVLHYDSVNCTGESIEFLAYPVYSVGLRLLSHESSFEKGTLLTRLNNSASSVGGAHLLLTFTGHKAIGYRR